MFCLLCIVYVACYVGIFSKLRSLQFDEQQFFVNEDEFEQTNNPTGDLNINSQLSSRKKKLVCMCMSIEL